MISNLRWDNKKMAIRLGMNVKYPRGYWSIRFDKNNFHYNLHAGTLMRLLMRIVQTFRKERIWNNKYSSTI